MLARRSFAAVLFLAVSGLLCSLLSAQTFSAETIGVGDRVVTIRPADLKRGATSLATVEAGTELVATAVRGDWVGLEVERDGSTTTGWIHKRYLRRIGPAAKGSGKAITTAEEFRKTLDAMIRASREAIRADKKQYEPAPYVAFSLKVARQRIEKAGDDFRQREPDVWRLAGINKVRGFVYDREQDDLILVGAIEAGRAPLTLDDLVVALRARLVLGEWPLVSIDPTPDTEKTQLQHVRYEGGIRGSLFALDMLAADYEMKGLGLGYVEAGVPDFHSHWDRWLGAREASASQPEEVGARFWFYPINPDVLTREGICAIQGLTVGVFTEVLSVKIDGKPVEDLKGFKDASGDAFAEELSRRFAELARDHYAFNRLRGLQELVGVSKALEQLDPRPELSWWLKEYRLPEVDTPAELPVAQRRSESGRRSTEASGGVRLTALALKVNRGDISALRKAVLSIRPGPEALRWAFSVGKWVIPLGPGQVSPETIAPLFAQAVFLHHHERYAEALVLFDRILQTVPRDADVWNNKGIILAELGRLKESADCLNEAIKIQPDWAMAWFNKGCTLRELGRRSESLECVDQAIGLNRDYAEAWCEKAATLAELGRPKESLACSDRAIELKPDYAEAWGNKAAILNQLDESKQALDCYQRAIQLNPNDALTWYNKGVALEGLDRLQDALGCYDRAVTLNSDFSEAWGNKGGTLAKLGQLQEALRCLDRAIELKPNDAKAWFNKGVVLYNLQRFADAKGAFRQAEELGHPGAQRSLEIIQKEGH